MIIDTSCLNIIAIPKLDNESYVEEIVKKLRLKEIQKATSSEATQIRVSDRMEKLKNRKFYSFWEDYSLFEIFESNLWSFISCNEFYDLNWLLNSAEDLAVKYPSFFAIVADVHSGVYKLIKFEDHKIVRFFTRDANENTTSFGKLLPEELELSKNKIEDYFFIVNLAKSLLREDKLNIELNKLSNDKIVTIGKRFSGDNDKYCNQSWFIHSNENDDT